ncbi:MAG: serine/threonine-protein kinase [Bacteroidales bacterium]|nr:serine/threonine-protein kinase [Bacteroidales bacterium]
MNLSPGTLLAEGRYTVKAVLGQGGFGITYLGEQTGLGRKVAIKEFFMDDFCDRDSVSSLVSTISKSGNSVVERFKDKFIKEARLIAKFSSNHIIKIHDVFEENGTAYYVMEFLEGKNLQDIIEDYGPMAEDEALYYIRQVALALSEVHDAKMLHLDVKPTNIMLNKKGEAVLIDFGISKHYDESGGQTSATPVGVSTGFTPVEQYVQGGIDNFSPSTDIYSLAATLYYLLTGEVPPEASVVQEEGIPPMPETVSQATADAIVKTMCCKRRERPKSIAEFMELLDGVKEQVPEQPVPEVVEMPKEKKPGGIALKITLALVATAVIIAAMVLFIPTSTISEGTETAINFEEEFEDALELINSDEAEEVQQGVALMEKLEAENYVPAIDELAHTYGWCRDSASLSRKRLLGIEYYTSGGNKYLPVEDKYNNKAHELYTKIIESSDEHIMAEKANAAFRLAAYSANKNSYHARDFGKALEYLKMARGYAAVAGSDSLLKVIDRTIEVVEKKHNKEKSQSSVVYQEIGESIKAK